MNVILINREFSKLTPMPEFVCCVVGRIILYAHQGSREISQPEKFLVRSGFEPLTLRRPLNDKIKKIPIASVKPEGLSTTPYIF